MTSATDSAAPASAAPPLPPLGRAATSLELTLCALDGGFRLQFDASSGRVQYPPREIAAGSLSEDLVWREADRGGAVLAATVLRASGSAYARQLLPWRIVLVGVPDGAAGGARIVAHALDPLAAGDEVRLELRLDRAGRGVFCAFAAGEGPSGGADGAAAGEPDPDAARLRGEFLSSAAGARLRVIGDTAIPSLIEAAVAGGAREILVGAAALRALPEELRRHCAEDRGEAESGDAWPVRAEFG